MVDFREWKHVFKLDPERDISDDVLEQVCVSGTDAILVGGSTGITFDNTVDLMSRIRRYEVPCVLEVSDPEAIVPGFDLYFIPIVLNAKDPMFVLGYHHEAIREWGPVMPWDQIVTEGYIILNGESTAAKLTQAQSELDSKDLEAYGHLADKLLHLPIVYMEYSGTFGDMEKVRKMAHTVGGARLFYGGGIDSPEKARLASEAADTIVVGNAVYERLADALATVKAVKGD